MSVTETLDGTAARRRRSPVIQALKAEFARHDKTQRDVAEVLGIAQAGVSRRMSGEVPWTVDELLKVAAWLNVPPSRLVDAA